MSLSSNTILTEDDLKKTVDYYMRQGAFAFDVESIGEYRGVATRNQVNWLSLATYGDAKVIPFGHPIGSKIVGWTKEPRADKNGKIRYFKVPVWDDPPQQLEPAKVFEIVKPLFFAPGITKIAHNAVFDLVSVRKYFGEPVPAPMTDSIVCRWLVDENIKKFKLKELTKRDFGFEYDDEEVGKQIEKHPFNKVAYYSFCDARYSWFIYQKCLPLLEEEDLMEVFQLENEVLEVIADMKATGARIDRATLVELKSDLENRIEETQSKVIKAAGKEFNLNAPAQKAKLLYSPKEEGGQGLKPWKLTGAGQKKEKAGETPGPTDYSTDADALESYPNNELAKSLLEYQELSKIYGTYVIGYLGDPTDKDKPCIIYDDRIHTDFVQYGTTTGRFSSRAPNLQNVPAPRTELGKKIRGLFVAGEGRKLIVADYGQIELVILAHYLGKGKLYEGFHNGIDPHTMTAAGVLGKEPKDVTSNERQLYGKTLNFATNYGVGPQKVANMLNVSMKEAKAILKKHQKEFPEIYEFKDRVIRECRKRKSPHIRTLSGRKRRLPTINSSDQGLRQYAERQAFNSLIQGGNADIIKMALVRAKKMLPPEVKIILTVHDEIVLDSPEELAEEAAEILHEAMLGEGITGLLRAPLSADIKIVDKWSEAK